MGSHSIRRKGVTLSKKMDLFLAKDKTSQKFDLSNISEM
jgi:hypothetical protein